MPAIIINDIRFDGQVLLRRTFPDDEGDEGAE